MSSKPSEKDTTPHATSGGQDLTTKPAIRPISTSAQQTATNPAITAGAIKDVGGIDPLYYIKPFQMEPIEWPADKPYGTFIFRVEIAPINTFTNLQVLSGMYWGFSGGLEFSFMFVSSAVMAGKLVAVITPPGIDLQEDDPSAYSYYNYMVMDIRESGSIQITAPDQRIFSGHINNPPQGTNPALVGTGGTLWLMVLGPAQTTVGEFTKIQVIPYVRCAPDFRFYRMIKYKKPKSKVSYDSYVLRMNRYSTSVAWPLSLDRMVVQSSSTTNYGDTSISFDGKQKTWPYIDDDYYHVQDLSADGGWVGLANQEYPTSKFPRLEIQTVGVLEEPVAKLANKTGNTCLTFKGSNTDHEMNFDRWYFKASTANSPRTLTPPLKESIVVFSNRYSGQFGITLPEEWRRLILDGYFGEVKPSQSILFRVMAKEGKLPLIWLRLHFLGYFTTNYVSKSSVFDLGKVYIQYSDTISETQNLPPSSADMRMNVMLERTEDTQL